MTPNSMFKFRFSIRYMLLAVSLIAILLAIRQSERGGERYNRRVASLDFSVDGSELAVALYQHQNRDADLERDFRRTISVMNGETLSDSRVLYRDRPRKWTFFESDRFDEIGDKKWISENAREFSDYHTTRFWKTQSQIEYSIRKVFLIGANSRQLKFIDVITGRQSDLVTVGRNDEIQGFDISADGNHVLIYGATDIPVPMFNPDMVTQDFDLWQQDFHLPNGPTVQSISFAPTRSSPASEFDYITPDDFSRFFPDSGSFVGVSGGQVATLNISTGSSLQWPEPGSSNGLVISFDTSTQATPSLFALILDNNRLMIGLQTKIGGILKGCFVYFSCSATKNSELQFSPKDEFLAVSTNDQILLYDIEKILDPITTADVMSALHPTRGDGRISVLDPSHFVIQHDRQITAFDFAPDGNTIAVGDDQGYVSLWDVAKREKIAESKAPGALRGIPWQLTAGLLVVWAWVFWRTVTRVRTSKRATNNPEEQRLSDDDQQTD